MAFYSFRAIDENSVVLMGKLNATDESELERKLNLRGLTMIEAEKAGFLDTLKGEGARFHDQDLLDFSFFLHLIITSGIPLTVGLLDLSRNQEKRKISEAAELVLNRVESGMSLSAAMQESPSLFPYYYVQMIKAGEGAGSLDKILNDLMEYIEWQMNFRKTVRAAFAYPIIILSAVASLITLLFAFVFPKLLKILTDLRVETPLPTKIVVAVAGFFQTYFLLIVATTITGIVLMRIWMKTDTGRRRVDAVLLSLPLIGALIKKINLSRYFKAVATLYMSGMNMEQIFTIASGVVPNVVMHEALTLVTDSVMTGDGIARAMQKSKVFPSLVIDMVSVGEKTGNLESVAVRATNIFDKEVPDVFKKILTYFEPLIIVFLGGVVLIVLLSMFLPIYRAVGGIRVR
ncbi:MAG: type II secretion system F family protein [Thermodesulfovibrionales bacterium]|jgi:type II secretory pathway component PulF